jgi:Peptidase family S41
MKRRHALSLIAAVPALSSHAQPKKPAKPLAPPPSAASAAAAAELASDIDLTREILAMLHPGLLRYNSPLQIDAMMASVKRSFAGAPDLAQRYLVLSRFLATLKCGHSHANAFNQSPAVVKALFDRKSRLPFAMRWIGEQMVVTGGDLMAEKLPPGTLIGAINGVPARTMLQTLLLYARADGNNDAQRRSLLDLRGRTRFETFDVFQGLHYGEPASGVFRLDVRTPDGVISTLEAPALTMDERHAQLPAAATATDAALWDWRVDEQGVAVLTMPSWALHDSKWDWRAWLNDKLDALAADSSAKGLVVDLRGNEGGLDCGNPILERFLKSASALPMRRLVRYQKTPEPLNRYLDTWDNSFRDWGGKARPFDSRFFSLPAGETTLQPKGAALSLPLVVLTDAANSSATFAFAQRIKATGAGKLVGEATGGNQRGINASAFFFVRLPASGIEPDVKVEASAGDIAAGRDAPMERALALTKGS